jgi:hypothetical protein
VIHDGRQNLDGFGLVFCNHLPREAKLRRVHNVLSLDLEKVTRLEICENYRGGFINWSSSLHTLVSYFSKY